MSKAEKAVEALTSPPDMGEEILEPIGIKRTRLGVAIIPRHPDPPPSWNRYEQTDRRLAPVFNARVAKAPPPDRPRAEPCPANFRRPDLTAVRALIAEGRFSHGLAILVLVSAGVEDLAALRAESGARRELVRDSLVRFADRGLTSPPAIGGGGSVFATTDGVRIATAAVKATATHQVVNMRIARGGQRW